MHTRGDPPAPQGGLSTTRNLEMSALKFSPTGSFCVHTFITHLDSCERMQQAASLQNPVFDVGALLATPCICNLEILKIALRAKILVFLIGQKSPSGVHYLRCVYTKATGRGGGTSLRVTEGSVRD